MFGTGNVQGPQGGQPFERLDPDLKEAVRKADNPGRLNRNSIMPFDSPSYLRADILQHRPTQKPLLRFDVSVVPGDEVKSVLGGASRKASETDKDAEKLALEAKKQKAVNDLETSVVKLNKNIFRLRRGPKKLSPGSGKKVRVLAARLARAKRTLRTAKSLESLEKKVSGIYNMPPSTLRTDIKSLSTTAEGQVNQLKGELDIARAEKKRLDKQKKAAKAAMKEARKTQRQEQKVIDRQLQNDRNKDRQIQRRHEIAGKSGTQHLNQTSVTRTSATAGNTRNKAAAYTSPKTTMSDTRPWKKPVGIAAGISPVRTAAVNMEQFLAGIKPSKGLSVKEIENRIRGIKTRDDFKQVLVDMRAAKLDPKTHYGLRSLLNAGLCGFMRDDRKFKTLDRFFVAHVISMGDNRDEAIREFTKAAARLKAKLDRG
ncbi:MAG: hypothetical protein ACR2PT_08155 [Endozoicomonas sp.]